MNTLATQSTIRFLRPAATCLSSQFLLWSLSALGLSPHSTSVFLKRGARHPAHLLDVLAADKQFTVRTYPPRSNPRTLHPNYAFFWFWLYVSTPSTGCERKARKQWREEKRSDSGGRGEPRAGTCSLNARYLSNQVKGESSATAETSAWGGTIRIRRYSEKEVTNTSC